MLVKVLAGSLTRTKCMAFSFRVIRLIQLATFQQGLAMRDQFDQVGFQKYL
jgi:hypothetical protein